MFTHSPRIVTDGLVLYLDAGNTKSYPGSGTVWKDLSGNGNDGTLVNGVGYSNSNGGSLTFDGVDDYTSVGSSIGNAYVNITVSVWFNPSELTQTNGQRYFIIGADDNSSGGLESVFNMFLGYFSSPINYSNNFNGQYIIFGIRSVTQSTRFRPISIADNVFANQYIIGCAFGQNNSMIGINKWVNTVGVYDGIETTIYINGIFSGTSNNQPDGINRSVSGDLNTSTVTRYISHNTSNVDFNGKISNTQIYNRALTSQEILQNYKATKGRYGL